MVILTSTEACRKTLASVLNEEIKTINEKINSDSENTGSYVQLDSPLSPATVTLLKNVGYAVTDTEVSWNDQYLKMSESDEEVMKIATSRCELTLDEEIQQEDNEEADKIPTIPELQDYKMTESESEVEEVYEENPEPSEDEPDEPEAAPEPEEDDESEQPESKSERDYSQDEESEPKLGEDESEQELEWKPDDEGKESESDEDETEHIFDPEEIEMCDE